MRVISLTIVYNYKSDSGNKCEEIIVSSGGQPKPMTLKHMTENTYPLKHMTEVETHDKDLVFLLPKSTQKFSPLRGEFNKQK